MGRVVKTPQLAAYGSSLTSGELRTHTQNESSHRQSSLKSQNVSYSRLRRLQPITDKQSANSRILLANQFFILSSCFIEACTLELYTRYRVHPCRVHPTFRACNLCFSFLIRPCNLNSAKTTIASIFVQRHSFLPWCIVPHAGNRGAETSDDG